MNETICRAIANRQLLQFYYAGGTRIVEPHCHGITTEGYPGLRAYQTRGFSSAGTMGWKLFDLSKAIDIVVLSETFPGPHAGFRIGNNEMSSIYCQL